MAVVERLGGCCYGVKNQCTVREKTKSGIKTVTEVLSTLMNLPNEGQDVNYDSLRRLRATAPSRGCLGT